MLRSGCRSCCKPDSLVSCGPKSQTFLDRTRCSSPHGHQEPRGAAAAPGLWGQTCQGPQGPRSCTCLSSCEVTICGCEKGLVPMAPLLGMMGRSRTSVGILLFNSDGFFFSFPSESSLVLCPPYRFPGSSAELRLDCGLDLLPGDGLLLVRAEAAEAQQPRSLGLRGQHHQQRAGAAEPDQKPHREARGQHGPHQGLREQKLQNVKNQDTQL